tara:strand:+ start:31 stop:339 length:309 start_codon:yes stop_codon:yes gene_type:complete
MAISQVLVGTSATTIFTSSGNNATTAMFFMNDNGSARDLTVFIVKSGASAGTANTITKAIEVTGGNTYVINTEKIVLANGDSIQALASATNSIYATISTVSI